MSLERKGTNQFILLDGFTKREFFLNFFFVLGHIIYAEQNGFEQIVDMHHYPTLYNEKQKIDGKRNAWEYYFEQPSDLSVIDGYFQEILFCRAETISISLYHIMKVHYARPRIENRLSI